MLAGTVVASALRAVGALTRLEIAGGDHLARLRQRDQPFIMVVWHGRMLLPIYHHRGEGIVGMVSRSRDGDVTASALEKIGYATVRGSSSRGGREAYHALLAALESGRVGAIIPDGPRGPARTLKPGPIYLAQELQLPILPMSSAARPAWVFHSWDRFVLPLPGARGVVVYGAPVSVPREVSATRIEQLRLELERDLVALDRTADAHIGGAASAEVATAARAPRS